MHVGKNIKWKNEYYETVVKGEIDHIEETFLHQRSQNEFLITRFPRRVRAFVGVTDPRLHAGVDGGDERDRGQGQRIRRPDQIGGRSTMRSSRRRQESG